MIHPVLMVKGETAPEVWEKSLIETWQKGTTIKTEYDQSSVHPSKDCTMIMVIEKPLDEPRIHLSMPGGFDALEKYRREIIDGDHDHWINPEEGKWTYTYHQRLFNYPTNGESINQIDYISEKLSSVPYSRRAQGITWKPIFDPSTNDPPCLQRVWGRCFEDDDGRLRFDMNLHWRSRDAYKAAFMNIYAFTELQRLIADMIAEKSGEEVLVGKFTDISDSYHIYGNDFTDFKIRFLRSLKRRNFYDETVSKSRTIRSDHTQVQSGFQMGKRSLDLEKRR